MFLALLCCSTFTNWSEAADLDFLWREKNASLMQKRGVEFLVPQVDSCGGDVTFEKGSTEASSPENADFNRRLLSDRVELSVLWQQVGAVKCENRHFSPTDSSLQQLLRCRPWPLTSPREGEQEHKQELLYRNQLSSSGLFIVAESGTLKFNSQRRKVQKCNLSEGSLKHTRSLSRDPHRHIH